jgi:phosphatidate cytidylyltransferase
MTRQRLVTAFVLIPVVIAADLYGPTWLIAILVALIAAVALHEFFALANQAGLPGHAHWTIFCALLLVAAQYFDTSRGAMILVRSFYASLDSSALSFIHGLVLVFFILGTILVTLATDASPGKGLRGIAIDAGAFIFVAWPLSFLVRVHATPRLGPQLLLFVLLLIWTGDSLAYVVGRRFGRHAMAPRTSPKKTWEGAAANLAGSVLVALIFALWLAGPWLYLSGPQLFALAVLANLAGQIGDLAKSIYKRSAGAKDSGTLLPGHGGVLDRIDSLIFAAPVVWYYVSVVVQSYP